MISLIMPTYNCSEFITGAIKSILMQSFKWFEFLIMDDGSVDDTNSIVKSFDDNRIKYFRKEHTGLSDSLDYGIKKASNELIARMDADDITHPVRLEKHFRFISANPGIDIVSNWYAVFQNNEIQYVVNRSIFHEEILKNLALFSDICHPSILFKKSVIEKINGFKVDDVFDPFGDYLIWLKNKSRLKFYNIPEVLHFYRSRENSLSNLNRTEKRKLIYEIQKEYYIKNIEEEFDLTSEEAILFKGWREYLYGDINKSWMIWKELGIKLLFNPSVIAAASLSLLPQQLFERIWGKKIPEQVKYHLRYYSHESQQIQKEFGRIVREINNV